MIQPPDFGPTSRLDHDPSGSNVAHGNLAYLEEASTFLENNLSQGSPCMALSLCLEFYH